MRFLQKHAEIIVTVCIAISILLGGLLMWLVSKRHEPVPVVMSQDVSTESPPAATASNPD